CGHASIRCWGWHTDPPSEHLPQNRSIRIDTPRFESSEPSQPPRSLPGDSPHSTKSRHFRRLAAKSPVCAKEFWASRTRGCESGSESLLADFSISRTCERERPETACVCAETGSNPRPFVRETVRKDEAAGYRPRPTPCSIHARE